jgi:hypothetical protein
MAEPLNPVPSVTSGGSSNQRPNVDDPVTAVRRPSHAGGQPGEQRVDEGPGTGHVTKRGGIAGHVEHRIRELEQKLREAEEEKEVAVIQGGLRGVRTLLVGVLVPLVVPVGRR